MRASSDFSAPAPDEAFVVDLEGFEGPLDVLLALARTQKVDLTRLSILSLADQYLAFIDAAHQVRLELAGDYLVMAAWLVYLKSRLLLPLPPRAQEPDADAMAAALARRLRQLERIRGAAEALMARTRLGVDVFPRAAPSAPEPDGPVTYSASLHDLLCAYAAHCQRRALSPVTLKARAVWSLADARARLQRLLGDVGAWTRLDQILIEDRVPAEQRATALASSFSASLELVREGRLDLRQDSAFAPLWLRARERAA